MSHYQSWGSTDNGQIKFQSLSDETLEGALDVMRKSFFLYEPICIGVDLNSEPGASEELEELCLSAAKDGVSVVAIDITTNKVVGVAFNKIQVLNNSETNSLEHFCDNFQCKSSKSVVDFVINVNSRINLFKHYYVNCVLEIMCLTTLPDYGKRRIGEMLVTSSLELGEELARGKNVKIPIITHGSNKVTNADAMPTLVYSVITSNYSYQITKKLNFDTLLEVAYDEFEFNGKKFSERIGQVHRQCVLVAKRLSAV